MHEVRTVLIKELEQLDVDITAGAAVMSSLAARKKIILEALNIYSEPAENMMSELPTSGPIPTKPNTMDLANIVIRNAGRPIKPSVIAFEIQRQFGLVPAKTLQDMLWKRCRTPNSRFFKDAEGNIGVRAMEAKMTVVKPFGQNGVTT
jgi:hypothetical protein